MSDLKGKLEQIKQELQSAASLNALEEGIDIKNARTSEEYERQIKRNCDFILRKSNYRVIQAVTRHLIDLEKEKKRNGKIKFTAI